MGREPASPRFGYDYATTLFGEGAKAGIDIPGRSGLTFDVGGGVRLVQNLGVGVTYSRYSRERTATLTTTIPSPLFFDDASTIEQQIPLQREENAVHIQAIYKVPIGSRIQVGAFGGPTYFRCLEDQVTRFALEAAFSPTLDWSVGFHELTQTLDRDSAWGYHGSANVTYLPTKHFGLGMTVRYSQASHTTTNHFSNTGDLFQEGVWGGTQGTETVTMKHGGLHWNGGVSVHF